MNRIDGKAVAASVVERVKQETAELQTKSGVTPGLSVIIVGDDPASLGPARKRAMPHESALRRDDDMLLAGIGARG